jgi:hypothetical protein
VNLGVPPLTPERASPAISLNNVDQLAAMPNVAVSNAPIRPARAIPTATSAPFRPTLNACRSVNPGSCSTKVHALQSA